eukprot:425147-Pyramimonas_sp.AAC.2
MCNLEGILSWCTEVIWGPCVQVDYYEGKISDLSEVDPAEEGYMPEASAKQSEKEMASDGLLEEKLKPRADLPPLLTVWTNHPGNPKYKSSTDSL